MIESFEEDGEEEFDGLLSDVISVFGIRDTPCNIVFTKREQFNPFRDVAILEVILTSCLEPRTLFMLVNSMHEKLLTQMVGRPPKEEVVRVTPPPKGVKSRGNITPMR